MICVLMQRTSGFSSPYVASAHTNHTSRRFNWSPAGTILILTIVLLLCIQEVRTDAPVKVDLHPRDPAPERGVSGLTSSETWICTVIASILVGLSGIFPLLVIPLEAGPALRSGDALKTLHLLLSFAVGSLLGDVFLHLLPEAWDKFQDDQSIESPHVRLGMWVLAGIFSFIILEKMFILQETEEGNAVSKRKVSSSTSNGNVVQNGTTCGTTAYERKSNSREQPNGCLTNGSNGCVANGSAHTELPNNNNINNSPAQINVAGYLNLLANSIDNFTHGLAVAASFLVSFKVGVLTTLAILFHEVPHEIGDFAILLKSGFNRWGAARAQLATASAGLIGAMTALSVNSIATLGTTTAWILPFTAGGFINIALVTVLPDLMKVTDFKESVKQLACMLMGVSVMAFMTCVI